MIGPHFYFDLIRLPRKGWSTVFRCLYLLILLVGLMVMYDSRRLSIVDFAAYARFAQDFAYTLIAMQDILILLLLPVYVASAISEERENQTLEALFISPLTDWQIVLGKFGGRLLHLGAVILAGVPLLAIMHLWGNVAESMLLYHLCNTFLLAMTSSAICILVSCHTPVVFQAVTRSYPFVFALGLVGEILAYNLPTMFSEGAMYSQGEPWYWTSMLLLLPAHVVLTGLLLRQSMLGMKKLRYLETKPMQKTTAAFALTDAKDRKPVTRKGQVVGSYINPLALPIRGQALFWKECLKDGTDWSLSWRWFVFSFLTILGLGILIRFRDTGIGAYGGGGFRVLAGAFGYTAYIVALAAYVLVVLFQTTICVAGERERDTLDFLLLLPVDRREILFCKWLGPLWRNWPVLAVSYLGVLLCLAPGVFSIGTALTLILLPWPFMLMCSFTALWLSVSCRRVLFANILMVCFLLLLVGGHIFGASYLKNLFFGYGYVLSYSEELVRDYGNSDEGLKVEAITMVFVEQAAFLLWGIVLRWLAFVKFQRRK